MDNMVKKKLSAFRKRQTVFVIIYGLINAAVIAGIIVYYRLKEQALAGALYLHDNAYGETFVRKMFSSGITDNNIRAGRTAMESAGYGSHGFSYMSRLNGEMYTLRLIGHTTLDRMTMLLSQPFVADGTFLNRYYFSLSKSIR